DLATSYYHLGLLLSDKLNDRGRLQEAEAAAAAALALRKQLAADFPTSTEFRQELATSHGQLGNVLSARGRLKGAEAAAAAALALRKQLAADFPNQPNLRNELAGSCVNLALIRLEQRDFMAAKAYLAEAGPHHESALKANPLHPDYRRFYQNSLAALIQTNA